MEIQFRALAPNKKGTLIWFDLVFTDGDSVYIDTKHVGIQPLKDWKALCRFTGLRDKNGKLIYEGDILEFDGEIWGDYRTNKAAVSFSSLDGWQALGCTREWERYCEIIGNIYENPELGGLKHG